MKDGDTLLAKLKAKQARRRRFVALACVFYGALYEGDWLYWIEYCRANRN